MVAGASSGIGEATALAFAKLGARVVLAARRTERLDAIVERIEAAGGRALAATCDVTGPTSSRPCASSPRRRSGRPDVLVNSAGMRGGGALQGPRLRTDRGARPAERPRRDVRDPRVPPGDARPRQGPRRQRRVARRSVRDAGQRDLRRDEARGGRVLGGDELRDRGPERARHVREPRVRRHRGLPAGRPARLGRAEDADRDRRDRPGRPGGHRSRVLGPPLGEPAPALPRRRRRPCTVGG